MPTTRRQDRLRTPALRGGRRRLVPATESLEARQLMAVFTVFLDTDSGQGSLRQAILDANDSPGADQINFLIGGSGPTLPITIALLSALPAITDPLTIDATTQPGYAGTPVIGLNGLEAFSEGDPPDGLVVQAGPSTVRGLAIYGFGGSGIRIEGTGSVAVEANYIGSDTTNAAGLGNGGYGVLIAGAPSNRIGSTNAAFRNIISDNGLAGVGIQGAGATRNQVLGNYIGLNAAGTASRGNTADGVEITDAPANTVGGTGATSRNIIGGNSSNGVLIQGTGATGNLIRANYIGLNATGNAAVGNQVAGVQILSAGNTVGATTAAGRNVISGNALDGVALQGAGATGNLVVGNYIGTDLTARVSIGNGVDGVLLNDAPGNSIGGPTNGARNVISGNNGWGLLLSGAGTSGNLIRGNIVGLSDGTISTPEGNFARLGNARDGIQIEAGASRNTLGGSTAGTGNVFSANSGNGIRLDTSSGNLIQGNAVGTTLFTGTSIGTQVNLGNDGDGLSLFDAPGNTIGGAAGTGNTVGGGNVIASNAGNGISILKSLSSGNVILGNRIGSDATGRNARPNTGDGISVSDAPGNTIGGFVSANSPLGGNLIIANGGNGITVVGANARNNLLIGNRIGLNINGAAPGNAGDGVRIVASGNSVGGTVAGAGNVISGNRLNGLVFTNSSGGSTVNAAGNLAVGNFIGTDLAGSAASIGNFQDGILIDGATRTTIGGNSAAAKNVVSGNVRNGLLMQGASTQNLIAGNYFGLDASGFAGSSSNAQAGVVLNSVRENTIGGSTAGLGNVISGNITNGLMLLSSDANLIQGNRIGTDPTGMFALANGQDGVEIIGGSDNTVGGTGDAARNIISGNLGNGLLVSGDVELTASRNLIVGNRIGTDAAGLAAIPNRASGIVIDGAAATTVGGTASGAGNLVSGNGLFGLSLGGDSATSNVIQGNTFGTNLDGSAALANRQAGLSIDAPDTTIGGTASGAGNLVSGNGVAGLTLTSAASRSLIQGNTFGTNRAGTAAIPNANEGILVGSSGNTIGGASAGAGNLISGNQTYGINLTPDADGNRIQGNTIGTDRGGTKALGNALSGIFVNGASGNVIGGLTGAAGNLISGNALYGIQLNGSGATGNALLGNLVGLARGGNSALGNALSGIYLNGAPGNSIGGSATGAGNIVSANGGAGLEVQGGTARNNLVQGNIFGLNATAGAAVPNATHGVLVNGAPSNTIGARSGSPGGNIISGNAGNGVIFQDLGASGNLLSGNTIGTDVGGNRAIANGQNGVLFSGSPSNQVVANLISGNALNGVGLNATSPGNRISGNTIGTSRDGNRALANNQGILVDSALDTMIDANLISGNATNGVVLQSTGTLRALVQANIIGTNRSATSALPNNVGLLIAGSAGNTLGGAAAGLGNIISGNSDIGIQVNGPNSSRNVIAGNKIGTNGVGNAPVSNATGIFLNGAPSNTIGGLTPGAANLISGNTSVGVYIFGADARTNRVGGNLIGTVADGSRPLLIPGFAPESLGARQDVGVLINAAPGNAVGGLEPGSGNLISGNYAGVNIASLAASGNLVLGNRIGTNLQGSAAAGNILGIYVNDAPGNVIGIGNPAARNIISGNSSVGLEIRGSLATNNVVSGNYIGTSLDGSSPVANGNGIFLQDSATGNTIGGSSVAQANVISGNASVGLYFFNASINNVALSNKIGTDPNGTPTARLANKQYGILLFNAAQNVIADGSGGINQNIGAIANVREFTGRATTTSAGVAQAVKSRKGKTIKAKAVPKAPAGPKARKAHAKKA